MSTADPIIRAIRIGKKANREFHEVDRALHRHGDADQQTPWTEHPNVKASRANAVQDIVAAGPQRRGGRVLE